MSKRAYSDAFAVPQSAPGALRTGRAARYRRQGMSAADAAAAAAMLNMVPFQLRRPVQVQRPELKGVDTDISDAGPIIATTNTNGDMFTVNLIVPGNGSFNRVGRKCRLKSLRVYGTAVLYVAPAATTANMAANTLRMVIVHDKQPSGVLPAFDTIFGHTLADGTEASSYLDPLRYDNTGRFRVLRDIKVDLGPPDHGTGGSENGVTVRQLFDEYIKLGVETVYSGQSSPQTIADISSGAVYVIFRANGSAATSAWSVEDAFARLRYQDA